MKPRQLAYSAGLYLVSFSLAALWPKLAPYDTSLLLALNSRGLAPLDYAFFAITQLGSLPFWCLMTVYLWLAGELRLAAYLAVGLALEEPFALAFKIVAARPRPQEVLQLRVLQAESDMSLPSGHAQRTAYGALAPGISPRLRRAALLLLFLVSFSRVYLGAHYPLDVAVGLLNGLAFSSLLRSVRLTRVERALARARAWALSIV